MGRRKVIEPTTNSVLKGIVQKLRPPQGTAMDIRIEENPFPDNGLKEQIKQGLEKLPLNKCLTIKIDDEMLNDRDLSSWQRYISTIAYNYKVKIQEKDFSTRIVDEKTIGVVRIA